MADYFTTRVKAPNIPQGQFSTVMRPFTAAQAAQKRWGFKDFPPVYRGLSGELKPGRGAFWPVGYTQAPTAEEYPTYDIESEWATPELLKDFLIMTEGTRRPIAPEEVFKGLIGPTGGPLLAGGAKAGIKGSVDPTTLRMFAGEGAATADKTALKKAKAMTKKGANKDEIWEKTGWFNDVDGKWKFEISDKNVKFNDPEYRRFRRMREHEKESKSEMPMHQLMPHPQLAKAYPVDPEGYPAMGYKDAIAQRGQSYEGGGSASPVGFDYVRLNTGYGGPKEDMPGMLSTALHEAQHLVQGHERFAMGGSPDDLRFVPKMPASVKRKANKLQKEYKSLPGGSPERIAKMAEHDALTAKYTDFGSYLRMAGEAEARNVQKRQKMTPAQRRKTPPWETLDVPEDELIVKF